MKISNLSDFELKQQLANIQRLLEYIKPTHSPMLEQRQVELWNEYNYRQTKAAFIASTPARGRWDIR